MTDRKKADVQQKCLAQLWPPVTSSDNSRKQLADFWAWAYNACNLEQILHSLSFCLFPVISNQAPHKAGVRHLLS